ncbi:hypothetical protein [Paenibacillus qinlingensis]|uniref:hypothetical protein n=1 Tax=Paenibacillus qinlingensis TaxID=1837343 RepID=UPI00286D7DED|nr:hypothetical protein [Paenibacillus qinlingensis]
MNVLNGGDMYGVFRRAGGTLPINASSTMGSRLTVADVGQQDRVARVEHLVRNS